MTISTEPPRWLKVPEAANRLNTSVSTVRRLIAAGELPSVRVRGQVRVPSRLLDEWMREQEEGAVAAEAYTARS